MDLALVLEIGNRPNEGVPAAPQAIGLCEQKGNLSAARARALSERLTS